MNVAGLHIAVLGAGESGESAAKLLRALDARVTVLDSGKPEALMPKIERLAALQIGFIAGTDADTDATVYDLGILSPGIDPVVPLVRNFRAKNIDLIGELELADSVCGRPVVGITGTNGKTTTTQLVEAMLNAAGVSTVACGNIGPAFSAKAIEAQKLDVVTVEISSFQLEEIRAFRPKVAVWLGFAPDHLDRYPDMESYYAAKVRIFENQTADDFAVVNLRDKLPTLKAKVLTFSAYQAGGDFELRDGVIFFRGKAVLAMRDTQLRGHHNAENLMAALGVGVALGVDIEKLVAPLCAYRALPHRCELIRVVDGVEYVNDSKATNLDSLEKALAGEARPVVLIAGGKDKGFEFDSVASLVAEKCRCAVLIGEMAERIERVWSPGVRCINVGHSLERAVSAAKSEARSGDMVLFSPGTSSFDMFKNYADRGNQFRQLVEQIQTTTTPSQS
jgi:UDP-N-acetylmuramoylalanine--D-glutamate ligase